MGDQSTIRSLSIKEDFAPLLKLTIPLILTGVMQSATGFFENIFLARLGAQTLAAGALVAWLFFAMIVFLYGLFSSVNILISHKYGANDTKGISRVLRDGVVLAILLTAPTFLLFWKISAIFLFFGQSPELVVLATAYMHALAWGLFPRFILIVVLEFLIGLGHTRAVTVFTMLSIPVYIFLSYVLIFGKLGFPALGIAGAGWGMTIGDWLSAFFLCGYVLLNKKYRCYLSHLVKFTKPFYYWEILQLGMPMGGMYFVEVGFFLAMTLLMGLIGAQTLAASQIAMQYLGPLMGIVFSIAQAMTTRMGHELGANQIASAARAGYSGIFLSAICMCVVAVFYWTIPDTLISVDFNVHKSVNFVTVSFAKKFLFIAAFFQVLEAVRISLFGALRGLKDTRFTLYASIISYWCIALPIGYLLSIHFKLGGVGFWWGMVVGAGFSVVLLHRRFELKMRQWA